MVDSFAGSRYFGFFLRLLSLAFCEHFVEQYSWRRTISRQEFLLYQRGVFARLDWVLSLLLSPLLLA
jgi:hypothetical protein